MIFEIDTSDQRLAEKGQFVRHCGYLVGVQRQSGPDTRGGAVPDNKLVFFQQHIIAPQQIPFFSSTTCDTAGLMVEIVPKQILAVPVVLLCVQDVMMPYFINLL